MAVISREDAADEERWVRYSSAPLIATLVLPIIIGVILVLKCVFNHCCVRKTTTKDEMYGLEGRMTMLSTADDSHFTTFSTSSVQPNHPPASPVLVASEVTTSTATTGNGAECVSENCSKSLPGLLNSDPTETSPVYDARRRSVNGDKLEYRRSSGSKLSSSQDSADLAGSLRRASAQHRQLPDLPQIPVHVGAQNIPRRSSSVLSHDGTSELYATVGETPVPDGSERPSKRSSHYAQIRENASGKNAASALSPAGSQAFVNGVPGTSSVAGSRPTGSSNGRGGIEATPSSDSETYASSHHPYAKLKKNAEHPYARVRSTTNGGNGNDEETDTHNYDLPQFLSRQAGPSSAVVPSSSSTARSSGANLSNAGVSVVGSSADAEGPVPPRRIGRQWRRSSQPQVLNNDNASHFSGDSQDSRGYTSISVREPLSNIRSQVANTRSYDSHYATVSDDSEEMYAAIDDPIDGNYMRIPGEDGNQPRRPNWLGGPCVASPIPERREANSPLPPVPNVPPPDLSPDGAAAPLLPTSSVPPPPSSSVPLPPSTSVPPPPSSPGSQVNAISTTLPVYAQVTKKSKKGKTPVTPTASNASTSSQQTREGTGTSQSIELPNGPHFSSTAVAKETTPLSHHHSHHHPPHHRSKRAASLMDNTNPMDADAVDSRRWSKADISYSEFEVVRESIFPGDERPSPSASVSRDILPPVESPARQGQGSLVDEDNYNIIPEKSLAARSSRGKGSSRGRLDSGNYHEIEPPLNNTYQEIGGCKEPSDHYQEIGDRSNLVDDGGELYQEIERKGRDFDDEDEEEDDEGDQFYERVKPSSQKDKKSGSLGKKHGYEKIKRKGIPGNLSSVIPAIGSDEEEDDEDDDKPDQLYESVKYPPYERLKESKDDLAESHDEEGKNGSDFYEDIGYSRVKPKSKTGKFASGSSKSSSTKEEKPEVEEGDSIRSEVDVSQLYARVDKSKKRKGANTVMPNSDNNRQTTGTTPPDISGDNNEPSSIFKVEGSGDDHIGQLYSKVNKLAKSNKNSELRSSPSGVGGGSGSSSGRGVAENETHRLDNDNSIEYI